MDDETAETDQNKWLFTNYDENQQMCSKWSESVPELANITCYLVFQHIQRNYQTDQKTQDLQLTLEDADATFKGFGWVTSYAQTDFTGQSDWFSMDENAVKRVTTVSQEFRTQEENKDDDEESDPETEDEDLCDKDGGEEYNSASKLALSAAAALATLFNLNF